jgi:hypothetical protein
VSQKQHNGDAAYTNTILERLLEHYLAGTACMERQAVAVNITRFHCLCRAVLTEGYGPGAAADSAAGRASMAPEAASVQPPK